MTDFLGPFVISVVSRLQQSPQPSGTFILGLSRKHLWATDDALPPRPLDDVAVLDAPTPPSSRGGSLHLRVSGLQERANTA